MPNRIIKETICTSEDLDKLSPEAEILFYRLIVKADDFGAYYGNESIVKSTCFPLRSDEIRSYEVDEWLKELENAGLISMYKANDGRRYLKFTKWDKHQSIRAKKSKFPLPDEDCKHLQADDCKCPRNPIQSNTIQNESESNSEKPKRKQKPFAAPTVEEVRAYCAEKELQFDPVRFVQYYEAADWTDSKGKPVKNWKQKALMWEGRERNGKPVSGAAQKGAKKFNVHYDNE